MVSTATWAELFREEMVLTPMEANRYPGITSIAYLPDGKQMFSGSKDKIARRWDLQSGKEIKEVRGICKEKIRAVAVSRNGQWAVASGGDYHRPMLKAWEVDTGMAKIFEGHSWRITCIDISADSTLLASGADDKTARIWNLKTGKLVAGPFDSADWAGAVRFSPDAKKLAVKSNVGKCLEVWDIRSQKLDVRVGGYSEEGSAYSPVFWTTNIIAAFTFNDEVPKTIYEFDASTLKTVGTPFEGHTESISSLALLFDNTLLISASEDDTIKLWTFQSRQLIASFAFGYVQSLISSPDSLQLAYTFYNDPNIYIRSATSALLAILPKTKVTFQRLLNSDATRRPAVARRTPSSPFRHQMPTMDNQRLTFFRHIRKFFHTNTVTPVQDTQPRDPWDYPATLPLPSNRLSSAQVTNDLEIPRRSNGITQVLRQGLPFRRSGSQHELPFGEVAAGRKAIRLVAAKLPEYRKVDDTRHSRQHTTLPQDDSSSDLSDVDSLPDVHWLKAFLCYYSCWSHGRLRMPPRWRLECADIPHQDDTTNANSNCGGAHGGG